MSQLGEKNKNEIGKKNKNITRGEFIVVVVVAVAAVKVISKAT